MKLLEENYEKPLKIEVLGHYLKKGIQNIKSGFISFYHLCKTSCKISKKSNKPILRFFVTDGRTDRRTDKANSHLKQCIEKCVKLVNKSISQRCIYFLIRLPLHVVDTRKSYEVGVDIISQANHF